MDQAARASRLPPDVRCPPTVAQKQACRKVRVRAKLRRGILRGSAALSQRRGNSRAHAMKSCVTGLTVRFLTVTIPTGGGGPGSSTGSTFTARRPALNRNRERGKIARNGPLAISA